MVAEASDPIGNSITDVIQRIFRLTVQNQRWMTDITEHPELKEIFSIAGCWASFPGARSHGPSIRVPEQTCLPTFRP